MPTLVIALMLAQAASNPFGIRMVDLDQQDGVHTVVDREKGQYLGHPTTVLLEDGKTILCVYPKGHGTGQIILKRSSDGGKTWSERLPVPESWSTSKETPTIHRVVDAQGKKRLIVWSGLYPARFSISEDDGGTWSELKPAGDWGGIVVMSSVVPMRSGAGHYAAYFHDDGRFLGAKKKPKLFTVLRSVTKDGGLSWSEPTKVLETPDFDYCEPGAILSPDGKQLALLLRENSRKGRAAVIFSRNDGETWGNPRELPASLAGDRHVAKYLRDGRLFISFRDVPKTGETSPTSGDWVGWIGTWRDLVYGLPGELRVRIKDNLTAWDCAYPGVELLPSGEIVTTTYGTWTAGEQPYILSARFDPRKL